VEPGLSHIVEGSSFGLVLVDVVAVILVLSGAPLSSNITALVASYANLSFLAFSALGASSNSAESQALYEVRPS
jgi:hypothetical protein|tara:strand:- start:448 stop:669 length:222 start_codon:yes stop_codon:yes gene_type:complete